jgi:predicted enzyme related to lactoylglutathione lyase
VGELRVLLPTSAEACGARVAFFVDVLGLSVERSWDEPGNRGWMIRIGESGFVEILDTPSSLHGGSDAVQIVIEVDDVDSIAARAGAAVRREPYDTPWGHRAAQVVEPGGMVVNVFAVRA